MRLRTLIVSRWSILACFILVISACSTDPMQRWSSDIEHAQANHMPLLLYSVPFVVFPSLADVGFINLSKKPIVRVDMKVTDCGGQSEFWDIIFDGYIPANRAVTINATRAHEGDPDDHSVDMFDKTPNTVWVNRVVIRAIEIHYSDGTSERFDQNLSALLAKRVPNYCPARLYEQRVFHGDFVH